MDRVNNLIVIVNELVVMVSLYLVLLFSDFVPDLEDRFTFGYLYIVFFLTATAFNVILFIIVSVADIKKFLSRRKAKKAIENRT